MVPAMGPQAGEERGMCTVLNSLTPPSPVSLLGNTLTTHGLYLPDSLFLVIKLIIRHLQTSPGCCISDEQFLPGIPGFTVLGKRH